jgi:CO dehydrogenase maturation factor
VVIGNERVLTGKRIGIFGKGGSGKSTVTALLAQALARRGYDVCVLDADSTNVGLHQALGLEMVPEPLMDYFGGAVFSGGAVTCPVDDPTLLPGAAIRLDDLPRQYAARSEDGILFLAAGKIGDQGPGAGCDGPVAKIARDLRILDSGAHPVTLIDFKAGFEDSARGAITSLDWALVVVDPTRAAIQMAADMKAMVSQIKDDMLPATLHLESPILVELANRLFTESAIEDVHFVLNKIEDKETEDYLKQRLADKGIQPVGTFRRHRSVTAAWLKGTALDDGDLIEEAAQVTAALEAIEDERPLPASA